MKQAKFVAFLALSVVLAVSSIASAATGDVIGTIEPQKVLLQHPRFSDVDKRRRAVEDAKSKEMRDAIAKVTDKKKQAEIYRDKQQEVAKEEQSLMAPLFKEINVAIRTVAQRKGVTVVIDRGASYYGGTDLTDDVVQELKKKNAGK